jgi:hypothetical protein
MSYGAGTGFTITRQATSDTTNLPFIQYCTRYARNSGSTSTTAQYYTQSFENVNSTLFIGKTVTLSFYARAGANYSATSSNLNAKLVTGTGTDQNVINGLTGATNAIDQSPVLTTTWQRFSYTGSIGTSATQIAIQFSFIPTGTAGANDYYEVTGVQLDIGSVALPFRTFAGTIQGELAACQRYYQKSYPAGIYPGAYFPGGYSVTIVENNIPNGNYYHYQPLIVQTRAEPTITIYSGAGTTNRVATTGGADLAASSAVATLITDSHFTIQNSSGGALTASGGGFLFFYVASSEL